jgi:hypothetical protein
MRLVKTHEAHELITAQKMDPTFSRDAQGGSATGAEREVKSGPYPFILVVAVLPEVKAMAKYLGTVIAIVPLLFVDLAIGEEPAPAPNATKLSKEYLQRWTPGGDTNAPDLPYPHNTAAYQSHKDPDWRDERWQLTQKGPFLSHSILLGDRSIGAKLTAVTAGPGKFLLYDMAAASFVAGVTAGELRIDPARFGLLNRPQLLGAHSFIVPSDKTWRRGDPAFSVPTADYDYQGLHLQHDRVLLVTQVDGIEISESPLPCDDDGILVREIDVAAHEKKLWLMIAAGRQVKIDTTRRKATWLDDQGRPHWVNVAAASLGVELVTHEDTVLLHWPPTNNSTSARIVYTNAAPTSAIATLEGNGAAELPELAALRRPGPRRWGEPLATKGVVAQAADDLLYVVDRMDPPRDNPFNALFFISGLDFFANGDAAVCTAHGDVWLVRGLNAALDQVTWQRFATGLYQPLGLEIVDDRVIVLGRDQLTRLHDENGDGEADYYESFNHDLVDEGMPHAYAMRLERTPDGSFVFLKSGDAPHGSALLQLSPDGNRLEVLARGFRHPFGLGAGPRGEITVADSEGNWVPSSKIDLIRPGGFYGFLGDAESQGESPPPLRPLCYIPKVTDNACGGQFWHTSQRWGPYHAGGMFHFSWGRCTLHAVLEQQVSDEWQAATVQIPGVVLQAGPAEAEFHPRDGQLYVVGLNGWQTAARADGSFERIRYTGKRVPLPRSFAAHEDGIAIGFDEPIDAASLQKGNSIHIEQWNYRWSSTYGSYHYSAADPKIVGHDVVEIDEKYLSNDGQQVFVKINHVRPVDQIQVTLNLRTAEGAAVNCNVYGTINSLAPPLQPSTVPPLQRLLARENLVAWCIVPFDARKRGPEERAAMLENLGVRKVAYDWRAEHIATFDAELEAYARHGIELHAFWMPIDSATPLAERHWPIVLDLVRRHRVTPELWVMLNNTLVDDLPEEARPRRAAEILAPVARAAAERNCHLGFYNHGGWWGEPDNQIRVLKALSSSGIDNIGLVYNFHHGHAHVHNFAELAHRMRPYLLTVNINGMRNGGPQILPVGEGNHEEAMLRDLAAAGYHGRIGILHHRDGIDAEIGLKENLRGIERLLKTR